MIFIDTHDKKHLTNTVCSASFMNNQTETNKASSAQATGANWLLTVYINLASVKNITLVTVVTERMTNGSFLCRFVVANKILLSGPKNNYPNVDEKQPI